MTLPVPAATATTATKLAWLDAHGWTLRSAFVQGQYQLTLTRGAQTHVFAAPTYPQAVTDAAASLAEHAGNAAAWGRA